MRSASLPERQRPLPPPRKSGNLTGCPAIANTGAGVQNVFKLEPDKTRTDPHGEGNGVPVLSWDYCFLGSKSDGVDTPEEEAEAFLQAPEIQGPLLKQPFGFQAQQLARFEHTGDDCTP